MTIEQRIETLERELSLTKRRDFLLWAVVCILGTVFVAGAVHTPVANTVEETRAKRFVIEDKNGNVRIIMGTDQDSDGVTFPFLRLYDEDEQPCAVFSSKVLSLGVIGDKIATLGVIKDGPWLELQDKRANALITVSREELVLRMRDEKGITRARLHTGKTNTSLDLCDERGNPRAFLQVGKDGPALGLMDENEKMRAVLTGYEPVVGLAILDAKGKPRAVLGKSETVTPDEKKVIYPESSLLLFGPDGKVLWQAP